LVVYLAKMLPTAITLLSWSSYSYIM